MRDAPGHIRPCRLPLIEQLPGYILEGDNMPTPIGHYFDGKGQQLSAAIMLNDRVRGLGLHQFGQLRGDCGNGLAHWRPVSRGCRFGIQQKFLRR